MLRTVRIPFIQRRRGFRLDTVPLTVGSEGHWSDPDIPPLGSGYETDDSTSSVGSFRTCSDGEHDVL